MPLDTALFYCVLIEVSLEATAEIFFLADPRNIL
jgi:hypothetical protein